MQRRTSYRLCLAAVLVAILGQAQAQSLPDIKDIFQSALTCLLIEPLLADMPVEPLYRIDDGGNCESINPDDASSSVFYADAACQRELPFEKTSLSEHCDLLLDSTLLGEGEGISTPVWTLPPGSRMDLGALSLDGVQQPYMQRLVYRRIATPAGECELEMRVYAKHPDISSQQSLLALHGGSWSARGFGFFGLELSIPHYVDNGFVVYAPFYRLLGDSEGSAACHNASIDDAIDDAAAALQWVNENASSYGSQPTPVLFGQSAGAHLAGSLAINQPDQVAGAVLFYPPTDFTDFALRAQLGFYTNEQGLGILERVIGSTADQADISASPIVENSFPIRVSQDGATLPPLMMVHGMADDLVEPRQSVRLCQALSGESLIPTDQELPALAALREVRSCGADSTLHLLQQGQHALDVCLADLPIATSFCPSGSENSRQQVAIAIQEAVNFARNTTPGNDGTATQLDTSLTDNQGGGIACWLVFITGMTLFRRRIKCQG